MLRETLAAEVHNVTMQAAAGNPGTTVPVPPATAPSTTLPSAVKPSMPLPFHGKMDGTSVVKFIHQMDTYFDLVDLQDDKKMMQVAVTRLEDTAWTWY